jgi:hypothetical protein
VSQRSFLGLELIAVPLIELVGDPLELGEAQIGIVGLGPQAARSISGT